MTNKIEQEAIQLCNIRDRLTALRIKRRTLKCTEEQREDRDDNGYVTYPGEPPCRLYYHDRAEWCEPCKQITDNDKQRKELKAEQYKCVKRLHYAVHKAKNKAKQSDIDLFVP